MPILDPTPPQAERGSADHGWFVDVMREHHSLVVGICRRMCSASIGDEVAQEVFAGLFQRPELFDPSRGSLRSYLVTQARGRSIDRIRAEESSRRRDRAQQADEIEATSTEDVVEAAFMAGRTRLAVAGLPPVERKAIVATYYEGRTYREASVHLGLPEGTLKSQIRSGLRHLRAALKMDLAAA